MCTVLNSIYYADFFAVNSKRVAFSRRHRSLRSIHTTRDKRFTKLNKQHCDRHVKLKPPSPINVKLRTVNNVGKISKSAKLAEKRALEVAQHLRKVYAFVTFFTHFFLLLRHVHRSNRSTDFHG